jgi:hypothetical protein
MKMLLCLLLCATFSGCIPIGIQGRTSGIEAPTSGATARSTPTDSAGDVRRVSA